MREIKCEDITKTVKQLCMEAACNLPSDVFKALKDKIDTEPYPLEFINIFARHKQEHNIIELS